MWQHLFKVVSLDASHLQCDMLILPFDLPTARARLLTLRKKRIHIEADSIIVMRGIGKLDTGKVLQRASSIQNSVKTSGLAIVSVPIDRDSDWTNQLVCLLSHDTPLVNALPMAVLPPSPGYDAIANIPIMIFSRNLAQAARARVFAKRLEKVARHRGPQFTKQSDLLVKHINGKWQHEQGEATEIVSIRQEMETVEAGIKIPRFGGNFTHAKPPLEPPRLIVGDSEDICGGDIFASVLTPKSDQRRVLIDLYDVTDHGNRLKVRPDIYKQEL